MISENVTISMLDKESKFWRAIARKALTSLALLKAFRSPYWSFATFLVDLFTV